MQTTFHSLVQKIYIYQRVDYDCITLHRQIQYWERIHKYHLHVVLLWAERHIHRHRQHFIKVNTHAAHNVVDDDDDDVQ